MVLGLVSGGHQSCDWALFDQTSRQLVTCQGHKEVYQAMSEGATMVKYRMAKYNLSTQKITKQGC